MLALGCVLALCAARAGAQDEAAGIAPDERHAATARLIAQVAAREHYLGEAAVPAGAALLARLLDALDPARELFTRDDVAGFEARSGKLAEAFAAGDLALPFELHARYRARVAERMRAAAAMLDAEPEPDGDARFAPRGPASPWADDAALEAHWRKRVRNDLLVLELDGRTRGEAVAVLRKRYQ